MARSYRRVDRDQQFLMPPSLREWLPPDHLVWFVLEAVDQLDTSGFHARHPQVGPGRRAFDPDMLLALLVYAYAEGERSSRRIEKQCRENAAFQVLCGQDPPDHTVIARFRAAHEDRFADVFGQVLVLCARAGMGRVGTIAIDGTKIAANASRFANRAEKSLRAEAARITAEAAAVDRGEDDQFGPEDRGDRPAEPFADPGTRAAAIKAALAELEAEKRRHLEQAEQQAARVAEKWEQRVAAAKQKLAQMETEIEQRLAAQAVHDAAVAAGQAPKTRGRRRHPKEHHAHWRRAKARVAQLEKRAAAAKTPVRSGPPKSAQQVNLTDPASRVMATHNGWIQGYNAQLAVSSDHLIVALMLSQNPVDMHLWLPMLTAATTAAETIRHHQPDPAADSAAGSAADSAADSAAGLQAAGVELVLGDAGYFCEENLSAEGPDRLIAPGKSRGLRREAADDPRTGPPATDASAIDQMRHRLHTPEGLAAYAQRGATVEPVNGHLKDQVGLRRFSRRGLTAAASELHLAAAAVNLLKLHRHLEITAT